MDKPYDDSKKVKEDYQDVENPENTNNLNLEEKWELIKADYHKKYTNLNDNDLMYLPDRFQKMTSNIASKTKRCNAEVNNEIRQWKIGKEKIN